jgi:anti-sigma factor RsiW
VTPGHGIDMDLLADYVGGALDGTPEAATVERLIADDPAWAQEYARLSEAVQAVTADLRAYGTRPEPMPVDVVARVDAALNPVPANVVALEPHRARRRWSRRAAPVAVAAGVLIVVGLGATLLQQTGGEDANTAGPAAGSAERSSSGGPVFSQQGEGVAPKAEQPLSTAGPQVLATGINYQPDTVRTFGLTTPADQQRASAPEELRRFTDRAVLDECLDAIRKAHGLVASIPVVDLARYAGAPAIVARLVGSAGSWVWVSGPNCGPADADKRFSAPTE